MKQVVPEIYILDCKKALGYYKELFGGEVRNLQMSDDNDLFRDTPGRVVHAELHVNSRCIFYFADIFNKKRASIGNISLMLHMDSREELEKVFDALSHEGHVAMEPQKTFSGGWHAIVTDRFGAPWSLNFAG